MGDLTTTKPAVATGAIRIPELKAQVLHLGQAIDEMKASNGGVICEADCDKLAGMIAPFKTCATEKQINGRVTRLLINPAYKRAAISEEEMALVIADWCVALGGLPYWAIEFACRWWVSADNPRCGYYPVAGEVARRARVEMANVNRAEIAISDFNSQRGREARAEADKQARIKDDQRIVALGDDGSVDYKLACIRLHQPLPNDLCPKKPTKRGKSASVSRSQEDLGEGCPATLQGRVAGDTRGHVASAARKVIKTAQDNHDEAT